MSKSDEEIIKSSLFARGVARGDFGERPVSHEALVALDRILARTVPELPDGYTNIMVQNVNGTLNEPWTACIQKLYRNIDERRYLASHSGRGDTPRAACEAAIAKIGKQP